VNGRLGIEYGLIASLIAVALVGVLLTVSQPVDGWVLGPAFTVPVHDCGASDVPPLLFRSVR
jgi:hypothetical protein